MAASMFVWLQAAEWTRRAVDTGEGKLAKRRVHSSVAWSPLVIASLVSSEATDCRQGGNSSHWAAGHAQLTNKVLGLAVVRPLFSVGIGRLLAPAQREVYMFWQRILK